MPPTADLTRTIETPRLLLRPWAEEDLAAFHRIWGDPQVIWWGPSRDLAQSAELLAKFRARLAWRAVVERATGHIGGNIVGNVVLQRAPWNPDDLEVGWHLARDSWGRGYATEAARAVVEETFAVFPVSRVVAAIHVENERSRRVAERLGFVREGAFLHGGLPHDLFTRVRPRSSGGSGAPPAPA
jgi:ribosomal-protein-alanine N-acetyltransferase